MKVNSVITLETGVKCLLLDKANYENENYFLAILLDEKDEPTDVSCVLKEIIEDNETFIEREGDKDILTEVLKMFTKTFNKQVSELTSEDE